jgi:hypothetical protein
MSEWQHLFLLHVYDFVTVAALIIEPLGMLFCGKKSRELLRLLCSPHGSLPAHNTCYENACNKRIIIITLESSIAWKWTVPEKPQAMTDIVSRSSALSSVWSSCCMLCTKRTHGDYASQRTKGLVETHISQNTKKENRAFVCCGQQRTKVDGS